MSRPEASPIQTAESASALFQKLIIEAEDCGHIDLPEVIESYLVFLLQRFNRRPHSLHETVAIKYLTAETTRGHSRLDALRDTGDCCLLLAGLFPEQASRRMVSISYFVRIGRSCYGSLARSLKRSHRELYEQLNMRFGSMLEVLQIIHDFDDKRAGLSPINAYDLWQETGSRRALQILCGNRSSMPVQSQQQQLI